MPGSRRAGWMEGRIGAPRKEECTTAERREPVVRWRLWPDHSLQNCAPPRTTTTVNIALSLIYSYKSLLHYYGRYGWVRHIVRQHASFMSCWPDTSGCVEHMYNRHTEMEQHTNVSVIHLICRFTSVSLTRFGECVATRIH
jgi:hypothetical protein